MPEYMNNALIALGISFIMTLVLGPFIIPLLRKLKVGQNIRDDGPPGHVSKSGTPTMGGIIIILAVVFSIILSATFHPQIMMVLLVMVAFGGIGFWDDYIKVVLKRSLGLKAREKISLQVILSLLFGIFLVFYLGRGTEIIIPFSGVMVDLGYFYIPFLVLVLISTSNAVNLTDGLDGLAAGITFIVAMAFVVISFLNNNPHLLLVSAGLAGACLGFIFFNRYPAKVFMGDTGSMALGGAIGALAVINKAEIALFIIGGVYVLETMSVILQVASFQLTGKRIFLMSPIHHHFELKGWSEPKVVRTFYALAIVFVIIGLVGFKPQF